MIEPSSATASIGYISGEAIGAKDAMEYFLGRMTD